MQLSAFHLPPGFDDAPQESAFERDGVRAMTVRLTPERLDALCRTLIAARRDLAATPVARTITAIDAATRALVDPEGDERGPVLRALTAFAGLSPAMAEHVLDRMAEDWRAEVLHELVETELGGAAAVDHFLVRAGGTRARAVAPPLGLHVFAGNVPGVSVTSIVRALLVRSATVGKPASGEPVLAPTFARLLAAADPLVGACCAVFYWPGGDAAIEAAILEHARLVVHYGSQAAIESLRPRARPGTRFVEHGPRISFAVVNGDAVADEEEAGRVAAELAAAVAVFDQQGCVSPQAAYVLGEPAVARDFAGRLAAALERLAADLPRGRLEAAEAAAIHDLRTRAEFRAIAGADVRLWCGSGLSHTVIYDEDPTFVGSCLNRTIHVRCVASVQQLWNCVAPAGDVLQTVGIAGFDHDQTAALTAGLAEIGATRVTPISAMPWPPPTWHHDGRGPLLELVRWIDLEA